MRKVTQPVRPVDLSTCVSDMLLLLSSKVVIYTSVSAGSRRAVSCATSDVLRRYPDGIIASLPRVVGVLGTFCPLRSVTRSVIDKLLTFATAMLKKTGAATCTRPRVS